ncbi:hypothetical protein KAI92_01745 [Candidatus Parcubacteria bacterium]|nr:hypothetical protein [Candidatus Parcubacteria bacterium]
MAEDKNISVENKINQTKTNIQSSEQVKTVQEKVDLNLEKVKIPDLKKNNQKESDAQSGDDGELGNITSTGTTNSIQEEQVKKIELILANGIEEFYREMDDRKKQEFKRVGEETAKKINKIMQSANFKVNKIIDLIKKWLKVIPGVNKFFVEQEAKIKADQIIKSNKTPVK